MFDKIHYDCDQRDQGSKHGHKFYHVVKCSNVRMQHVMSDTTAVTWNAPARYLYLACKYAGHVTPICSTTTAMLGVV